MSSPAEFYNSLPPVTKFYGTACLLTTVGFHLGVINHLWLYFTPQLAFKQLQLWRIFTNFFFLGPFSMNFGIQLIMLARYGVQLEKSSMFDQRPAEFVWMLILAMVAFVAAATAIPSVGVFMGSSIIFMLMYLWSREYPTARVNLMGLVSIEGFYLPWALLFINVIFGGSLLPDLMGIVVGHLYYFCTVLYPRSGGRNFLQAPRFIQKMVMDFGLTSRRPPSQQQPQQQQQYRSPQAPAPAPTPAQGAVFRGRSYRLGDS